MSPWNWQFSSHNLLSAGEFILFRGSKKINNRAALEQNAFSLFQQESRDLRRGETSELFLMLQKKRLRDQNWQIKKGKELSGNFGNACQQTLKTCPGSFGALSTCLKPEPFSTEKNESVRHSKPRKKSIIDRCLLWDKKERTCQSVRHLGGHFELQTNLQSKEEELH